MSWKTIRSQIGTLLDSLTKIHEVSSTPKLEFGGYPAAYVVPSDSDSDYETNTENERVYAFLVRVFYETKETGLADAIDKLEDAVDDVIDAIDDEDRKQSGRTIAVDLPTNYTFLSVEATPSIWGQLEADGLVFSEIRVRVHVSYDAS